MQMLSLDILDVSLILVGIVSLVLLFDKWEDGYFKRRGIKSPSCGIIPFAGNLTDCLIGRKHYKDIIQHSYNMFPDEKYFGLKNFRSPLIVIKDLELIKKITIKDFEYFSEHLVFLNWDTDPLFGQNLFQLGEKKWREMRPTLSPAFTSSKMKGMFNFVTECAELLADFYQQDINKFPDKENAVIEIELKDLFSRYANDVIATCAFGIKVDSLRERNNDFYRHGLNLVNFNSIEMLRVYFISSFRQIAKLIKLPVINEDTRKFFKSIVLSCIDTREKDNIFRPDMIQLLIEAKKGKLNFTDSDDEEQDTGFSTVKESTWGKNSSRSIKNWSDDTLVAQALVFVLAGLDTSSAVQSFLAYELIANPGVQRTLQKEVDELLEKKNGKATYTDIHFMKYMDMVVSETLRLWPQAVRLDRKCVKDYVLPPPNRYSSKFITIKKGDGIIIPAHAIHHDPKYYENPDKFYPERFSDENKKRIDPMTYMPFGFGPRNCIGSRFALMEIKVVTFYLLAKFDLIPTAKTQIPLKIKKTQFIMGPSNGFWAGLRLRNKHRP